MQLLVSTKLVKNNNNAKYFNVIVVKFGYKQNTFHSSFTKYIWNAVLLELLLGQQLAWKATSPSKTPQKQLRKFSLPKQAILSKQMQPVRSKIRKRPGKQRPNLLKAVSNI